MDTKAERYSVRHRDTDTVIPSPFDCNCYVCASAQVAHKEPSRTPRNNHGDRQVSLNASWLDI